MVKLFVLKNCPYCNKALQWIAELKSENLLYQEIEIEIIDELENSDLAQEYDYYYVPAIFSDKEKLHEGVASKAIIENIFKNIVKKTS